MSNSSIDTYKILTYFIVSTIIIFNKFLLPYLIHLIVDKEKWPTLTALNISYSTKLTLLLFTNTAFITFFVEILILNNFYGIAGGMIYSEFFVFILNAFVSPIIWLIDPWGIVKNIKRKLELKKGSKSIMT